MKNEINNKESKNKDGMLKVVYFGFLHVLVSMTSISVVTSVLGFNMPIAFLFAGVSTIIFHIVTKNKLPIVLGVSGLYVGGILSVVNKYDTAYAMGGIIFAGLVYVIFAFIMYKWQDKIMKYFPDWLLSATILLIGLNLLPIGRQMMGDNLLIGIVAFTTVALANLSNNRYISMAAMPLGILIGTIVAFATGGIDMDTMSYANSGIEFISPKFALAPILTIAPLSIAVAFETLGDTKNNSDIIGIDIFKEVGLSRIFMGNGLATMIGGLFGANAYTTYSENNAFVMLSKYYNPNSQIVAALLMIALSFSTATFRLLSYIPTEAFGGIITYLFAMITVNAIKQMCKSKQNIITDDRIFIIVIIMIGISSVNFTIKGVEISSVAIATLVGTIANAIIFKRLDKIKK